MNKRIFGIRIFEMFALLGLYLVLSIIYHVALWFNRPEKYRDTADLLNPESWFDNEGLQYTVMFLATCMVWLVVFKLCKHWKLWQRLLLHLFGLPFFVFCAWKVFYFIGLPI
jgi:Ca2+/Na+ antiporter